MKKIVDCLYFFVTFYCGTQYGTNHDIINIDIIYLIPTYNINIYMNFN